MFSSHDVLSKIKNFIFHQTTHYLLKAGIKKYFFYFSKRHADPDVPLLLSYLHSIYSSAGLLSTELIYKQQHTFYCNVITEAIEIYAPAAGAAVAAVGSLFTHVIWAHIYI